MPKISASVNRIVDANINRAKEGLRVCEELTRFILDDKGLTGRLKNTRHRLELAFKRLPGKMALLEERRSLKDVGRCLYGNELIRKNCRDILFANIQRVKESVRVLEEFSKLINAKAAIEFKKIRYDIYETEKRFAKKVSSLSNCR